MANYPIIVYNLKLRELLELLILGAYGRLCLCAIAIYIAFKLLST